MARTGSGSPEIIDLTGSTAAAPSDADDDVIEIEKPKIFGNMKKAGAGRKRQRGKRSSLEAGEVVENHPVAQGDKRSKRRSRSPPARRPRSRSPKLRDELADLFYVDVVPAQIPASVKPISGGAQPKLLLPDHVSVFNPEDGNGGPIEIIRPPSPTEDDEDFIEYLDYDDRSKGVLRYFDEVKEESKSTTFVCKNCRAQGQHRTIDCPVQICLTCGAKNEHSTRSCPISKTCYDCGMKGHVLQNCPNGRRRGGDLADYGCDRCGVTTHKTNECPTWWRMYEYVSDDERLRILQERESKRELKFAQGGEGYIGSVPCCYCCGGVGHWGDDCNEVSRPWDFPSEASAFSVHNVMSGPFFDPATEPSDYQVRYREELPNDWMNAPSNVGKQGRKKDQARMEQRLLKEQETDGDDWFQNPRNARNRSAQSTTAFARLPPPGPKKMTFGLSIKDAGRQFQPPPTAPRPSLIERISGDGGQSGRRNDRRGPDSHSKRDSLNKRGREDDNSNGKGWQDRDRGGRDRDRDRSGRRDKERELGHRRHESGPRYTGGYSSYR